MFAIMGGLAGFQPEYASEEARLLRVACVLITHLRAKVELLRQPGLSDRLASSTKRDFDGVALRPVRYRDWEIVAICRVIPGTLCPMYLECCSQISRYRIVREL